METEKIEELQKRVKAYSENEVAIHITTFKKSIYNGYVTNTNPYDFFMMIDREDGEIPVFYQEIKNLSHFTGDFSTLKKKEGIHGKPTTK